MNPAYAPYRSYVDEAPLALGTTSVAEPTMAPEDFDHTVLTAMSLSRSPSASWGLLQRKPSRGRVLLVLNQLAVMCSNGLEIAEALETVAKTCRDDRLAASLIRIHEAVSQGNSFSTAVANHGQYFPLVLAPMLAAAEASGEVPATLKQTCDRMRGELEMRGAILSAMIYPLILITASGLVMSALIVGVLPQFSKVFVSIGKPIPASTEFLLDFGSFCRHYWMLMLGMGTAALGWLIAFRRHPWIQRPLGHLLMHGPFIRDAYRPLVAGRNFRTIAAMILGGVPLLQTVRLTRRTTRDAHWQRLLDRIEATLIDGQQASSVMIDTDFLPSEAAQMMATAERTGRVGEVLEDIGNFYEQEGARRIKRLVIALEPVIILAMGVVVAGVVMSVMLPLLDVSTIRK